jgi:hypothetical protein
MRVTSSPSSLIRQSPITISTIQQCRADVVDQTEFNCVNFQQFATNSAASGANGFDLFEEEDRRRENAFKTILIISLCLAGGHHGGVALNHLRKAL